MILNVQINEGNIHLSRRLELYSISILCQVSSAIVTHPHGPSRGVSRHIRVSVRGQVSHTASAVRHGRHTHTNI